MMNGAGAGVAGATANNSGQQHAFGGGCVGAAGEQQRTLPQPPHVQH